MLSLDLQFCTNKLNVCSVNMPYLVIGMAIYFINNFVATAICPFEP